MKTREYMDRINKMEENDNKLFELIKQVEDDENINDVQYDILRSKAIRKFYLGY